MPEDRKAELAKRRLRSYGIAVLQLLEAAELMERTADDLEDSAQELRKRALRQREWVASARRMHDEQDVPAGLPEVLYIHDEPEAIDG